MSREINKLYNIKFSKFLNWWNLLCNPLTFIHVHIYIFSYRQGSAAAPHLSISLKFKPAWVPKKSEKGTGLDIKLNFKVMIWQFQWVLHAANAQLPSPGFKNIPMENFAFFYVDRNQRICKKYIYIEQLKSLKAVLV